MTENIKQKYPQFEVATEIVNLIKEVFGDVEISFDKLGKMNVGGADRKLDKYKSRSSQANYKNFTLDIFKSYDTISIHTAEGRVSVKIYEDDKIDLSELKPIFESIKKVFWTKEPEFDDYMEFVNTVFKYIKTNSDFYIIPHDERIEINSRKYPLSATYDINSFIAGTSIRQLIYIMNIKSMSLEKTSSTNKSTEFIKQSPLRILAMYGFTDKTVLKDNEGNKLKIKFRTEEFGNNIEHWVSLEFKRKGKSYYKRIILNKEGILNDGFGKEIGMIAAKRGEIKQYLEKIILTLLQYKNLIGELKLNQDGTYTSIDRLNITVTSADIFDHIHELLS